MNELGKKIIKGKVRIVTPVHIGGAQEKHFQRGLDYISNRNTLYFLDEKAIIEKIGIDKYSNALFQNNLFEVLRNMHITLDSISSKVVTNIVGEIGTEIKSNLKNALSGKPIIPGSSLKGAIRSAIYNYAGGGLDHTERNIFGGIEEDVFRYIIVSDIEFNKSEYVNTKTYNLISLDEGGWKHAFRQNTTSIFNPNGFTFPVETIALADFGSFQIVLNVDAFNIAQKEQEQITNYNRDQNDRRRQKRNVIKITEKTKKIFSESDFFELIRSYTNKHLKAEKDFFVKYGGDKTDLILNKINSLIELNMKSPLLRLGFGSGFHAMTGDTIHDSHIIDHIELYNNRSRGKLNSKDSAKSRKIAFTGSDEKLRLYPMGFVQLMTEGYYEEYYKKEHEARQHNIAFAEEKAVQKAQEAALQLQIALKKKEEEDKKKEEQDRRASEEALKPKMVEVVSLKKAKLVDGVVTGQMGNMLQFKPYVKGFEDKIFEIRYASGMPDDTIIQIMCQSPKGKTLQFQGSPIKKE